MPNLAWTQCLNITVPGDPTYAERSLEGWTVTWRGVFHVWDWDTSDYRVHIFGLYQLTTYCMRKINNMHTYEFVVGVAAAVVVAVVVVAADVVVVAAAVVSSTFACVLMEAIVL